MAVQSSYYISTTNAMTAMRRVRDLQSAVEEVDLEVEVLDQPVTPKTPTQRRPLLTPKTPSERRPPLTPKTPKGHRPSMTK